MPDITLALSLLKKPIDGVLAVATGEAKQALAKLKATNNLKKLYQKLNATQRVKTIWNVDRALALSSFYHPVKIKSTTGKKQVISSLDEFPTNAVVISGTVGQGKSILLRHLLGREIRTGTRVPILIELRRVPSAGLKSHIIAEFEYLMEVGFAEQIFDLFADNGKISLLLDGYDEIEPERLLEITASIETLVAKYPEMRVLVTSRPDSGIEKSSAFDVVPIAKLEPDDLHGFFSKILSRDKAMAEMLVKAVRTSSTEVQSLTSTPLLATLLTIVYRAHQTIPTDFSEFYDELFQILLVRHDLSKPGYRRARKTKLSDRQIQQVFEAYCFKTKASGSSSIPRTNALEYAEKSINSLGVTCNESEFLHDVIKVTCLLQEEGSRVEFVHQSVQEFFAARYVLSRPEEVAKNFYSLVLDGKKRAIWEQVLVFLSQLDKYRSSRYFFIPAIESTLDWFGGGNQTILNERIEFILQNLGVRKSIVAGDGKSPDVTRYYLFEKGTFSFYRDAHLKQELRMFLFGSNGRAKKWQDCFNGQFDGYFSSYAEIAKTCSVEGSVRQFLHNYIDQVRAELDSHRTRAKEAASSLEFMAI